MRKQTAYELLGGTTETVARSTDCTRQAVEKWPDPLPRRIADRVLAARLRLEWRIAREKAAPAPLSVPPVIDDALTV
jgi:hypothetical protein